MEIQKKTRITAIKDEVKELHPILNGLLRNIPFVETVEYTHGKDEMGADFLFAKKHEVLGTMSYVAVVAKIGRIEQAHVPTIARQVNEAFYPKLFNSGKSEIKVSEVWVITNQHISHGAKVAIWNELSSRKVEFINGDDLIKLIDKHFQSYWSNISLELGQYLHRLRARNEEVEQSVSLTNMARDVYIQQDLVRVEHDKYKQDSRPNRPKSHVDIFEAIPREKALLIEGEMGAGKSKLTRRLIAHFTTPQVYLDKFLIPIAISYKDLLDNYKGEFDVLIQAVVGELVAREVPENAKYLIIVDGIDEKNITPEEQFDILNKLVAACKARENIKLILTTRYLRAIENKEVSSSFMRLELLPLTPAKVLLFVKRICSQTSIPDRIFSDIQHSPLFRDLPRSPIAAILLANLINNHTKELPSNLPELYSKYMELTLGRWDVEKGVQSMKDYETLNNLMMELAQLMMANELPFLSISEVKEVFARYTKARNTGVNVERAFQLMRERCPIVTIDEAEGKFAFKHRTFAEYLYAQYLLKKRLFKIDSRAFHPYWDKTFYFAIGALRDCPEELAQLNEIVPKTDMETFLRIINMPNYYMAAFQTPYEVIARGIERLIVEAATFYRDITKRHIKTDLQEFPEMQLLCLFQHVIRNSYSYSFFSEAIDNAAINIAADLEDDEVKAYALFFLNVISVRMEKKSSFDWLLGEFSKILPLSVQLAICHEGKEFKVRTALMRRHERGLRHAIKQNKKMEAALEKMYGRPIRSLRAARLN